MHNSLDSDIEEIVNSVEGDGDKSARMAEIERFSLIIKDKRKDAIEARKSSGIEDIWQMCEDGYEGRDKYNRKSKLTKGRNTSSGLTGGDEKKAPVGRSTVIPNITAPYCNAAAARVTDILLPTDDRNWSIRPTPVPELVNSLEDATPAMGADGQPLMQAAPQAVPQQQTPQQPGMMSRIGSAVSGMFGGQPAPPAQQPVTVGDVAQQKIDQAKKAAERAQEVIDDWLVECKYHAEVRKQIESAARMGVGILKGPVPKKVKARAVRKTFEGWTVEVEEKVIPVSEYVSAWNFYPDGNCGEDVKTGSYCFERGDITARMLKDLRGGDYIDEMIDMCLEEGAISSLDSAKHRPDTNKLSDKDLFEIWYFHGYVSKKDMDAAGCECDKDSAPCVVTMVNDRIIRITMSVLNSGEIPYDVMVWKERVGHWAGIGVSEEIEACQKSLTSAVRKMQDNASISSGPQIIVDSSKIEPANGNWDILPNKLWRKKLSAEGLDDVRHAFTIVSIETRQVELLNIINYWTKVAEDVTSLPMLLQGQQGAAPDTLGATQIVNNNGNSVLRRIARNFDDRVTELHIGRYYEWLMLHGPEDTKGEFQIDARGSSTLVERDIQNKAMMQLLGASVNPAYELDPAKVMREVVKGMRIDSKNVSMDDEQKKAMAERQPPEDPRITAAKIMAESRTKLEEMDDKDIADHAVATAQLDLQRQNFEAQQNELDRQSAQIIATINERMQNATLTSGERQNLDKIKSTLAMTSAKLSVQKDLSVAGHTADIYKHKNPQVITPPTEPVGKAPPGQAWQK